jgi:hypothetical protein
MFRDRQFPASLSPSRGALRISLKFKGKTATRVNAIKILFPVAVIAIALNHPAIMMQIFIAFKYFHFVRDSC